MAGQRKGLSKKLRFEVFKRDSFTCQYCGAKAPDVLLHIDHIKPVAKGGKNKLTNLITSCENCNQGKGPRVLGDDSIVQKARAQAEMAQEMRNQVKLMLEWQDSLDSVEQVVIETISEEWKRLLGDQYFLNENGIKALKKLLRRFGPQEIIQALRIAIETYITMNGQNQGQAIPKEQVELAWSKVGGICQIRKESSGDPNIKRLYYIRGILKNRLNDRFYDHQKAILILRDAYAAGLEIEELESITKKTHSWSAWKGEIEDQIIGEGCPDDSR